MRKRPTTRHAKPTTVQLIARIYRRQIVIDDRLAKLTALLDLNTQVLQNKLVREWLVKPITEVAIPLPGMTQRNIKASQ